MERLLTVETQADWDSSISTRLGKNGLAVVAWKLFDQQQMDTITTHILRRSVRFGGVRKARPSTVPAEVVDGAYSVAQCSNRIALSPQKNIKTKPELFGDCGPITALHTDIHQDLPALTSLFVVRGGINAYFKLLPLGILDGTKVEINENITTQLEAWQGPHPYKRDGLSLSEEAKSEFLHVHADAGTLLAFPASGSLERGIQPSAHEVVSATSDRITMPLLDLHFAKY